MRMSEGISGAVDVEFFARLAELNGKFASSLPQTLARLSGARKVLDAAQPQPELVAEMHAVLHTLAGSAATFGFRVLGQQARLLEQRMRVFTTFDAVAPDDWEAWLAELDVFVAWGLRDPKAAYPSDESAI
jgi:HPt (histidine-containing phosphotransfer) domain-containing protein